MARPWIEAARPRHPSLIDASHVLDERLGVANVPSGTWIDEQGLVVRPPEAAFPDRGVEQAIASTVLDDDAPPARRRALEEARKIRFHPEHYVEALRDWVRLGPRSRFALAPDEVQRRSRARTPASATAAARFELGAHLARAGHAEDAIVHLREALRLAPDNWTWRRQAWSLLEPGRTALEVYGSDWLSDVLRLGAENYYPPFRA